MRSVEIFSLDTPYREKCSITGFEFGRPDAEVSVAVVGSLRGNEVQQTYTAAGVVRALEHLEEQGELNEDVRILVIPSANSFSMNISERFWPMDKTDINRMFPGYDQGETTQRLAGGMFEHLQGFTYGIQLCSYYLQGDFIPHVRITDTGCLDMEEAMDLADAFGMPYILRKAAAPFDTTTLNYNWQVWNTHAFSLYSLETETTNDDGARFVGSAIVRFLHSIGALKRRPVGPGVLVCERRRESDLISVRTTRGGFFRQIVPIGQDVREGDALADVLSTENLQPIESLRAPCDGRVFFQHKSALINGETIAFKVMPH